jgi:hypothetical protein
MDTLDKVSLEIATWCAKDHLGVNFRDAFHAQPNATGITFKAEPYFLLRRHPLYYGFLVFCLQWTMQDIGIKITNYRGATMAAANLYNAVRHEVPNSGGWQDMESFISIHTCEHIFVGRPPNNAKEYFRRY